MRLWGALRWAGPGVACTRDGRPGGALGGRSAPVPVWIRPLEPQVLTSRDYFRGFRGSQMGLILCPLLWQRAWCPPGARLCWVPAHPGDIRPPTHAGLRGASLTNSSPFSVSRNARFRPESPGNPGDLRLVPGGGAVAVGPPLSCRTPGPLSARSPLPASELREASGKGAGGLRSRARAPGLATAAGAAATSQALPLRRLIFGARSRRRDRRCGSLFQRHGGEVRRRRLPALRVLGGPVGGRDLLLRLRGIRLHRHHR